MPIESTLGYIQTVLCGKSLPFQQEHFSAIHKQAVSDTVTVTRLGLLGDEQANHRVHGGIDKAIHHYAFEHYAYWRQKLGPLPVLNHPGAFGENISTTNISETDLCLGDHLQVGTCLLEVSQSRQPCWKLNTRFSTPDMSQRVQTTGKTGWYYRVLQEGHIQAQDAIVLLKRPYPGWSLQRVNSIIFGTTINIRELENFAQLPLPHSWAQMIENRLQTGQIENMDKRLYGR